MATFEQRIREALSSSSQERDRFAPGMLEFCRVMREVTQLRFWVAPTHEGAEMFVRGTHSPTTKIAGFAEMSGSMFLLHTRFFLGTVANGAGEEVVVPQTLLETPGDLERALVRLCADVNFKKGLYALMTNEVAVH